VNCTASDASPDSPDTNCSFTVTVKDTQAPTCNLPANITQNNDAGTCGAVVTYTATASDNCGAATINCTPSSGSVFPVGTTTVACTASDTSPDSPNTNCSFTVTVNDTQGPQITLTTGTLELWPANHNYTTITLSQLVVSAIDNCGGSFTSNVRITSVTSAEPENSPDPGDGNTVNDIVIAANCKSVQLRAERDSNLNGRVYTINLKVADGLGNVSTASRTVVVPVNQSGGGAILGPGPGFTKLSSCP